MQISIAGAGAGKTTKIADSIIDCYGKCDSDKIIFCVAYTNNAAECIENKIHQYFGYIPSRIHISTIHSFLYQELIKPYYYLLFGIHFDSISSKDLSAIDSRYKNAEFKRLEASGYLHVEAISERAKWVFVKKSKDTKDIKERRKAIQKTFKAYCGGVFLDEAQDINNDILEILVQFHELGLDVHIMGDPKQDLRGYGNLRKLVDKYPDSVTYIVDCFRCPSCHLTLSNTLVEDAEKQNSRSDTIGILKYVYERDISLEKYLAENAFGLMYISEKNERLDTHKFKQPLVDENLFRELESVFVTAYPDDDEKMLSRAAYYYAEKMALAIRNGKAVKVVINGFINELQKKIDRQEYAKLASALTNIVDNKSAPKLTVSSIEAIKGMEHSACLFVLTPDLAPYLFSQKKDDNKTKHKAYVALTRSTDLLCIMITNETEQKYGRKAIDSFMASYVSKD